MFIKQALIYQYLFKVSVNNLITVIEFKVIS